MRVFILLTRRGDTVFCGDASQEWDGVPILACRGSIIPSRFIAGPQGAAFGGWIV